jgi:hypothetical protein
VWRVLEHAIDWFVLREGRYVRLAASEDGLFHSEVLPGLWLDAAALVEGNLARVAEALQRGLTSPEHDEFVARLCQSAAPVAGEQPGTPSLLPPARDGE